LLVDHFVGEHPAGNRQKKRKRGKKIPVRKKKRRGETQYGAEGRESQERCVPLVTQYTCLSTGWAGTKGKRGKKRSRKKRRTGKKQRRAWPQLAV